MSIIEIVRSFGLPAVLLLQVGTTQVESFYVATPPTGSDAHDCRTASQPCATFQHAVDQCSPGGNCRIFVHPGTYAQRTNISHFKFIQITAHVDGTGNCLDRKAVTVEDRVDGRDPLFWVQDHAILTLDCLTLAAYSSGTFGLLTRQFAIADADNMDFVGFPSGAAIRATETSKINVSNPSIAAEASAFAEAEDLSQVTIGGNVSIGPKTRFDEAFVESVYGSIVSYFPRSLTGGEDMAGPSFLCVDAIIKKTAGLPGKDRPAEQNENCRLRE